MLRNLAMVLFGAASLFVVPLAMAGEGVLRVICTVDGAEYAKGEIRVGGKVRGDCPRADIFLPAGEHSIAVEYVIGDGSLYRGNATVTLRDDAAKRQEVSLTKVFTEDYYYGKKDWNGLLKAYPNGRYADEAAYRTMSPHGYLEKFSGGRYASDARKELDRLAALNVDAGKTFRDCSDCPEMVVIPTGSFLMGSHGTNSPWWEKPQHRVTIALPYAMGKYPVTQAEWRELMGNSSRRIQYADRPVVGISWDDAQEFIRRLNIKTGKRYRLPSEAEWEYAARAGTTTRYFWGDDFMQNNPICNGCSSHWWKKELSPVGSFGRNGFGLYDMIGSVGELMADCWHGNYEGAPEDGSVWLGGECNYHVVRNHPGYFGGADSLFLTNREKAGKPNYNDYSYLGFRLARTLP